MIKKTKTITKKLLKTLEELTPVNLFIFNETGIIETGYQALTELNQLESHINWEQLYHYFLEGHPSQHIQVNLSLEETRWYLVFGEKVLFENQLGILSYVYDITDYKRQSFELDRAEKVRSLMLDITQSIFTAKSFSEIFELGLQSAVNALQKSNHGSIMIKQDEFFKPVAYLGFSEDVLDFELLCTDSFLSRNTNGKMNRFVRVKEEDLGHVTLFNRDEDAGKSIRSVLVGPIHINQKLYAMISIDSYEPYAFDEYDMEVLQFIARTIEVAITNHQLYQEKLTMSRHDQLTNLYNRHYFEEQFSIQRERAEKDKTEFSIVIIDVDRLKEINDYFGHIAGDELLKSLATQFKQNKHENDVYARFGGDEFIGMVSAAHVEDIHEQFKQIQTTCKKQKYQFPNVEVECSFSYGIAHYPKDGETLEALVRVADKIMYIHKRSKQFVDVPILK